MESRYMSGNRIKSRKLLVLLLLASPLLGFAQATLSIGDFSIMQGETKEVFMELDNTVEIRALQVRVVLPDSLILVGRPRLVTERLGGGTDEFGEWMPSSKSLSYNRWADGSHMIMVNSDDGLPFSGTEGAVISFSVRASDEAPLGEYAVVLSDVEMVYSDGENYVRQDDSSGKVTVLNRMYALTYRLDGAIYHVDSLVVGTAVAPLDNPEKEGHTFSGWSGVPETMPAEDVTVTGSFAVNSYQLSYTVDGEVYATDSIAYGASLTPIESPVKEGHTFNGWRDIPERMPAEDVTVTGSFTVNKYKLTGVILLNGLPLYTLSDSVTYGTVIPHPAVPSLPGYTFGGWTDVPDVMPAHDLTITASFTVNSYLLTYTVDGEVYYSDSLAYKSSITVLDAPVKEGHTFSGWSEIPETMPANDVVVTGSFTANSYKLTYMVDGELYSEQSVEYGTSLVAPAHPVKDGYTFSGWSEMPETMPAEDVTVTGNFTINSYVLTYMVDGDIYRQDLIEYGAVLVAPDMPAKDGYAFSGWGDIPSTMPSHDVTVTGVYVLNSTQTDAQGVVYTLDAGGYAFTVTGYTSLLSVDVVVPASLYDVPVTSVNAQAFMGAMNMESVTLPTSVTSVGDRVFYGCGNLLVIEWDAVASVRAECFDKPSNHGNMLVYVADAATPITYLGNVIIDGVTEKITLADGLSFRNTREFTARHISYTHEFTKQTRIGESGGWEALVLPFDVQVVTNEEMGVLLPFGKTDFTTSLPYWLAELQSDGTFAYVDAIRANTPFIMEVPNSDEYEEMYNIKGNVTFSAENVVVHATTSMPEPSGSNYVLVGCYEGMESGSRVYALNDEEYTADGIEYMPGGVFVSGDRDIRPFEAYVYSNSAARAPYLRISGRDGTGLVPAVIGTTDDGWYTLQGIRLNGKPTDKGVYIINRKKVIID